MKTLIIAEKPSVAKDIANALGGFKPVGRDYFEREDLIVSSAVGHLAQIDVLAAKSFPPLPIIPAKFDIVPIEQAKARLTMLRDLIKRPDVGQVVNCCDAGREGELIFHLLYTWIGIKKPTYRMWMQSMTAEAIRTAYGSMQPAQNYQRLLDGALCRSEADWLIGINGSRALSSLLRKALGDAQVSSVGRVQTPTLALIVHREQDIKTFKPRDYFELHARFTAQAGEYTGRWQRKAASTGDKDSKESRFQISTRDMAQSIADKCHAAPLVSVTEESKPTTKSAPGLFDLTTLQREANKRFGYSAMETLKLAQSLYETHKVTSYPRTDSSALPEDYLGTVEKVMATFTGTPYNGYAKAVLHNSWIKPNKKIFNDTKISDHFAIIPTGQLPSNLSEAEGKIYDLVVRRFIAVFFPPAEYLKTTRISTVAGEEFYSMGNVLKAPGWLQVYGSQATDSDTAEAALVLVSPAESVRLQEIELKALKTKPPTRYSEDTLLSAMEHASGDIVDDDDAKKAMAEKGLGTPATRAATIEGLIDKSYLARDGKQLKPTERAMFLISLLENIGLNLLTSAKTTGEWEYKLALMDKGQYDRPAFMREIAQTTHTITAQFAHKAASVRPAHPCPDCGAALVRRESKHKKGEFYWGCSGYPECKTTFSDAKGNPGQKKIPVEVSTEHLCPDCGAGLVQRKGIGRKTAKPYTFWACSGYPKCKSKPIDDVNGKPALTAEVAK